MAQNRRATPADAPIDLPPEPVAPGDYELDLHYKETAWFKSHNDGSDTTTQVQITRAYGGERRAIAYDVLNDGAVETDVLEIAAGEDRETLQREAVAWMARHPEGVMPNVDQGVILG